MKAYRDIGALLEEYALRGEAIRQRLREFSGVPEEEYFSELMYCLMTPQSSARAAGLAVGALVRAGFCDREVDPVPFLKGDGYYVRFHRTKGQHLLAAKARRAEITGAVVDGRPSGSPATREWLVRNVRGLGWKEASHFLRNIGWRDLAILDRHILRNLVRHGVLRSMPAVLTGPRYLAVEEKFLHFARAVGVSMDELDLLFWSRATGEILK